MPNIILRLMPRTRLIFALLGALTVSICLHQLHFGIRVQAASTTVVISQVYGGGGNSGANLRNDFIELFNRGTTPVSLAGWSVQYSSAGGTSWTATNLTGSVQPGQYYLIQEAQGAGATTNLPTPDATGTIAMSATTAKVALVNSTTALTGTGCPFDGTVVDFIAYGTGTNCSETAAAPTLTNTTAALRAGSGCTDTDNNGSDFTAGTPNPRNTASATNPCAGSTNPSGTGSSSPTSVAPGDSSLLTVTVTPGTNPTSTGLAVASDLSSIGGSATQPLFDDGTNGDLTPADNVYSFNATISSQTPGGPKTLPVALTDAQSRSGSSSITLTVLGPSSPSGTGSAAPNSLQVGDSSILTVNVTPGTNPTSSGITVTADLSSIGGSPNQQFFDDGTNGDATANNNDFTYNATIAIGTTPGAKTLPITISDAQGRSGNASISITVEQPPPPVDHVVISQIYGGGGNSGATFTNDYVELYNPTVTTFTLTGWSLQYASAAGTTWTNKQPLGGTIGPGEYYLVVLASGGAAGQAVPEANITGDINMSATTGKLTLVNTSNSLSGACPAGDPAIVDFVGYGASATCHEGSANAPAPSNTSALFRKDDGSTDTNQNGTDFQTGTPNPRRTAPIMELGPWVASTDPITAGTNAPHDATITISFSEPVDVVGSWYNISCTNSGQHNDATVASSSGFKTYAITPNTNFQFGEQCTVAIPKEAVHDQDTDDSNPDTDTLLSDYEWTFTVVAEGNPAPYPPDVHLTMGNPSGAIADVTQPNNYLMEKPTYALSYNQDKGTPNWVSWHLDTSWFGNLARVDTFRPDPAVPPDWYRVQATDYFTTGFDRGHMTPNADRDNENRIPINQETYLMSNMVPQAPDNNQGPWANLENFLRSSLNVAGQDYEMYIVSGPAGTGGTGSNGFVNTIANGHVVVPAYTWKVALVLPKGDNDVSRVNAATRTIAVIMPNTQGIRTMDQNDWQNYLSTVDAVEQLTGYDFFSNLPDAVENSIEAGVNGNNPPGTAGQSVTTAENTPTLITLVAASPNSNPSFTYTIVSPPVHGTLNGTAGNRSYVPDPTFNGADSFTFQVSEGNTNSNISTVNITVTEVNDSPLADSDEKSTAEDVDLNFPAAELTLNDSAGPGNENNQRLSVIGVSANPDTHGSVTLTDGFVTYSPDQNYNGPASFSYKVCDNGSTNGSMDAKCATGTVNLLINSVNDLPVASGETYNTNSNTTLNVAAPGLLLNDMDVDGDYLSSIIATTPGHGGLLANADGSFSYTPTHDYSGPDSFSYRVFDGIGYSNTATVSITVNDTVAPVLYSNVGMSLLLNRNSNLMNIGLTASATDNSGGPVNVQVEVFGDEDDQTATAPGTIHSPDAKDIAPETLRLRAERVEENDGRVYLIVITATDAAGNVSRNYQTVVVPKSNKTANFELVSAQAAAAAAYAEEHGAPPPDYFIIGDGPIIGPKQ